MRRLLATPLLAAGTLVAGAGSAQAVATTYYVSNAQGSGCSDAVSVPTSTQPWCSLSKANGPKQAGDRILLGRGSSWTNQQLVVSGAGTATAHIAIATFGTGVRPKLSLSSLAKTTYAAKPLIRLQNPSFWDVSGLELSKAGAGVLAQYSTGFPGQATGNRALTFTDLLVHDIAGVREGVPNGNGSSKSPSCVGDTANPQDMDLWQSGAIAVTGAYDDSVPSSTYFVAGVTIRDVEGHNNLNVVNIDGCDAKLGPPGFPGPAQPWLVRDVVVDNVWAYDGDGAGFAVQCNEGMRFAGVTGLRMTNSRMQNLGACPVNGGTAGIILVSVSDAALTNNTVTDVPATGSADMTGIDYEIYVDDVKLRNNLIARNAGPGLEFLSLRCGISDYNTHHEVSGNSFSGNGGGSLYRYGACAFPFSGTANDNLWADGSLVNGSAFSTWSMNNNKAAEPGEVPHYAADEFGAVAGASGWTYQTTDDRTNPGHWSDASFVDGDHVSGVWSGGRSGARIAPFEQTGGSCSLCASARVWTASHNGTIAIRSRALKSAAGGTSATVRVEKNGILVEQTQVQANDLVGQQLNPTLAVQKGDQVRFVVWHNSPNSVEWVSWAPSIAYLDPVVASATGDFANPEFTTPVLTSGLQYAPSGADWSFSPLQPGVAGAGMMKNGSDFRNPDAPSGTQAAFLQAQGWMSQTISGLRPGLRYAVALQVARKPVRGAVLGVNIRVDGQDLSTWTPGNGYAQYQSPSFTVSEGPHTIELRGTAAIGATAFLDDIHVVEVDEGPQPANSSFEAPALDVGWQYLPDAAQAEWTFTGKSGLTRSGSTWSPRNVPLGQQGAFIQMTGTVSTSVSSTAGGTYAVMFSAAQRPATDGGQTLQVLVDDTVVASVTPLNGAWRTYATPPLALTSGTHTLEFRGTATENDDRTAVIDDVRIAPTTGVAGTGPNPSFESPGLTSPLSGYAPAGATPWTFQPLLGHGGSGIAKNGSPFTVTATDGAQVAFLQRDSVATSGPGWLEAGGSYILSLDSIQRTEPQVNDQQLRLELDGVPVLIWEPSATWSTNSVFVSVPPSARGQLTLVGTRAGTDQTALVDNFRVSEVG